MNVLSMIGLLLCTRFLGFWGGLVGFFLSYLLLTANPIRALIANAFLRYLFKRLDFKQHYAYSGLYTPVEPLSEDYRFLGIASTVSDAELKQHYRRLMNQHHPDKVLARGLPSSQLSAAKERTQAIRAAYDRIRAERGLA